MVSTLPWFHLIRMPRTKGEIQEEPAARAHRGRVRTQPLGQGCSSKSGRCIRDWGHESHGESIELDLLSKSH